MMSCCRKRGSSFFISSENLSSSESVSVRPVILISLATQRNLSSSSFGITHSPVYTKSRSFDRYTSSIDFMYITGSLDFSFLKSSLKKLLLLDKIILCPLNTEPSSLTRVTSEYSALHLKFTKDFAVVPLNSSHLRGNNS